MGLLHFDRKIAGATTIWVIQFKPEKKAAVKPPVDFIIPSPEGGDHWMVANLQEDLKTLDSLREIQKMCGDFKKSCAERVGEVKDYVDPTSQLSKGIDALDELIRQFNEIMRRFKNPSDEEKKEENPPGA